MPPIENTKGTWTSIYWFFNVCIVFAKEHVKKKQSKRKLIIGSSQINYIHSTYIYMYPNHFNYQIVLFGSFLSHKFPSVPHLKSLLGVTKWLLSGRVKMDLTFEQWKKGAPGCLGIHPRKLIWIPKTNCYYMAILVSILNFSGVLRGLSNHNIPL